MVADQSSMSGKVRTPRDIKFQESSVSSCNIERYKSCINIPVENELIKAQTDSNLPKFAEMTWAVVVCSPTCRKFGWPRRWKVIRVLMLLLTAPRSFVNEFRNLGSVMFSLVPSADHQKYQGTGGSFALYFKSQHIGG